MGMRVNTKMWTPVGTTFPAPPEPEYKVFVKVGSDSTLEFSAHSSAYAEHLKAEYGVDYPVKTVARGANIDAIEWTQPPVGALKVA
jgi:hypothetical protein